MALGWLSLAIVATVGYHIVMKLTPSAANPYLSLALTYAGVAILFAAAYLTLPGAVPLRTAFGALNWTAPALAVVIALLDIGFLMLYRSGYEVSLGALVTQSAAALLLLVIGVALFQEKLSFVNVAGIALCVGGLWLVNQR